MRVVIFCHSLVSDWNHGNAHFLRGVSAELIERGHQLTVLEPRDGWSRANLVRREGQAPVDEFARRFPTLSSEEYEPTTLDLDRVLDHADLVLVHEWNDPEIVARIGRHRAIRGGYVLLFHDTHHRAATAPAEMSRFDLSAFDGVLAFGEVIRRIYLERQWVARAFTWHEAADTHVFSPQPPSARGREDLVWIGNWGDDERTRELHEFLLDPASHLRLSGSIHGVRYPWRARWSIHRSGLHYRGWLANHRAPEVFAAHRLTVHVSRRPYVRTLPGIPTIRVFEALACGIPLICAPWEDAENLFSPGEDYLVAGDGGEMEQVMRKLLADREHAAAVAAHGRATIEARHTCGHRVTELEAIHAELAGTAAATSTGRGGAPR
jgi:spore maturation protein CgeB